MQQYWEVYDQLLASSLPKLHAHLTEIGISPNQYLMDCEFIALPLPLAYLLLLPVAALRCR
eukprot:COSAG06_NODE_1591_length_8997_cov_166.390874_10_plen_61_part_00